MLMLLFQLGNSQYAIPVNQVAEVTPWVKLSPIAKVPCYVCGLFNYRGSPVPVIDLRSLIHGQACQNSFTTRIIMVNYTLASGTTRLLGLLAENVSETINLDEEDFISSGLQPVDASYLGRIAQTRLGVIQQVTIADLLAEPVQSMLFPGEAG